MEAFWLIGSSGLFLGAGLLVVVAVSDLRGAGVEVKVCLWILVGAIVVCKLVLSDGVETHCVSVRGTA